MDPGSENDCRYYVQVVYCPNRKDFYYDNSRDAHSEVTFSATESEGEGVCGKEDVSFLGWNRLYLARIPNPLHVDQSRDTKKTKN